LSALKITHDMETKQIVDSILESMRAELTQFVEAQGNITSSLEYEERVVGLSKQFGAEVVCKSMGKMPKSRNSKKSPYEFRQV
jgi:hypothetical protein